MMSADANSNELLQDYEEQAKGVESDTGPKGDQRRQEATKVVDFIYLLGRRRDFKKF